MAELGTQGLSLIKRSPGTLLVGLGFLTIYFLVAIRSDAEPTIVTYLGVGFGFLVTLAGIVLLFRELSRPFGTDTDFDISRASDIEHAVHQLGKNYDILRRQATQGFVLAGTFMALGILVILAGALGEMFGFTKAVGNLTTIAGVVVEVISGLGLYLFNETFKRLNTTSDRLYEMWKILAAFKQLDALTASEKAEMTKTLIKALLEVKK